MGKWVTLGLLWVAWLALGGALFRPPQVATRREQTENPARIVALAPNATEILFALGLGDQVVGVTQYSDYPPAATAKPKVGTFWQPSIEAIIALHPDLVVNVLTTPQQQNLMGRLERMGYRCLGVSIWHVRDLFEAIETLGRAAGVTDRAEQLSHQIRTSLDRLRASCADQPPQKVLWVVQRDPLRVAGRDTFVNELIELAGGENAIGPTLHKYPPIGGEQVITCGAHVIIEPAMFGDDTAQQRAQALAAWSRYPQVPAVASRRVYVIDADPVSRLGPRLYEGVRSIARCLYPDLFTE
jgi:iron complex transport system substrate-binding protein